MRIILASGSPRRKELLLSLGLEFEVITSDADERSSQTDPELLVEALAKRKGEAVKEKLIGEGVDLDDTLIIACDTVVHFEGNILGKPHDRQDAERMLRSLSDRAHCVSSGLYLYYGGRSCVDHKTTSVSFAKLSDSEIQSYLDTDEPYDKAGAYAIQGRASVFIEGFTGDYYNVVGLPMRKLYEMVKEGFGIELF